MMSKPNRSPSANQVTQEQAEQQLNQLVSEIRILESYYNEIVTRIQSASAALSDMRSSVQSIDGLAQNSNGDFLLPIGGGLLIPASNLNSKKLILSVGAGVAIEKDFDSAKAFLIAREKELETAMSSLEQQRREVSSRLDAGKDLLQRITGQA
ncbi:MAG TPA: prefoldin subunit alpha [Nitrososphaerales archaeon]|nr:prefoldin subunit alpha [Nitrososphaerales archaeon]